MDREGMVSMRMREFDRLKVVQALKHILNAHLALAFMLGRTSPDRHLRPDLQLFAKAD